MAEPDFKDEFLEFGSMHIGPGKAFAIENDAVQQAGINMDYAVPVGKEWATTVDGRFFLVETVEYASIKTLLQTLPKEVGAAPANNANRNLAAVERQPAATRADLVKLFARSSAARSPNATAPKIQLASARPRKPGVVLDYTTLNSNTTNYTFYDQTYYISGTVVIGGTTTIMPGAVIKYASSSQLQISGSNAKLNCLTTQFRPALLISKDDNSAGETISGSSGSPSGYYATYALYLNYYGSGNLFTVSNLRVANATTGIYINAGSGHVVTHVQVRSCQNGFAPIGADISLRNVLAKSCYAMISGSSSTVRGENTTFDSASGLNSGSGNSVYLTNCLLTGISSSSYNGGLSNVVLSSGSGVYQSVGGGANYLAANSPYRNMGATSINATLGDDLKKRTTYPPMWLTNSVTLNTTLYPQAQRDTDRPDIGYHYDPLDFIASGVVLSGVSLLLTNGVVIGVDSSATNYGFRLDAGATVNSEGSPAILNRFVRTHAVQEQPGAPGYLPATFTVNSSAYSITARFRFTDFPMLAGDYYHFPSSSWNINSFTAQDSQFRGGNFHSLPNNPSQTINWLNNLFEGVNVDIHPYAAITLVARNNLFKDGALKFSSNPPSNYNYSVFANLFDKTTITQGSLIVSNWNNGYVTNCTTLTNSAGGDVITNSTAYETSWLGKCYLPTNSPLINAGSGNANNYGLYHYTVLANQTKETNSVVDIGFHYVSTDGNGVPLDYDSDGVPDYLEDYNGNGSVDSGETDWQAYNSLYGVGSGPGLQVFTPLKP